MSQKKINEVDFSENVRKRILEVEGGDIKARVAEALLDEPTETPAEIAELETIPDEEEPVAESPKTDFVINGGPIGNIHLNHLNANANRENFND